MRAHNRADTQISLLIVSHRVGELLRSDAQSKTADGRLVKLFGSL